MKRPACGLRSGKSWSAWLLLGMSLVFFSFPSPVTGLEQDGGERTWRLLSELSEAELAGIDLSVETPRNLKIPYLPAKSYPFASPYTAEEMGFRAMEFPHWKRWSCAYMQVYGSIDATGFFANWGKNITMIAHQGAGVAEYLYAGPGQNHYRALLQFTAPPEMSGNQTLYVRYRTESGVHQKAGYV
jgi:hypothetical protein